MADTTVPTPATEGLRKRKTIGMDMVPPYRVYVDELMVAEYETEEEADVHYAQLRVSHLGKPSP